MELCARIGAAASTRPQRHKDTKAERHEKDLLGTI
jgi:hypothetical protein